MGATQRTPQGDLHYPADPYPKPGARLARAAPRRLRSHRVRRFWRAMKKMDAARQPTVMISSMMPQ